MNDSRPYGRCRCGHVFQTERAYLRAHGLRGSKRVGCPTCGRINTMSRVRDDDSTIPNPNHELNERI